MDEERPSIHPVTRSASDAEMRIVASAVGLPEADRRALLAWSRALLRIRAGGGSPLRKAREALSLENATSVLGPVARTTGRMLADVAWNDRGWTERLGVGAMALAGAAAAGQGAAVAAVGAAVGVPLWIVLGSGDGFAAALRDALDRSLSVPPAALLSDDGPVVDAEWEFEEGDASGADPTRAKEPLWRVFRRAYRDARSRQRTDPR